MFLKVLRFVLLLETVSSLYYGLYMKKQPLELSPCNLDDRNFNKCFARNFQVLLREWREGVPGLLQLGPLDPLSIKHIKIEKNLGPALNLHGDWENVVIMGANQAMLTDFTLIKDTFTMRGKIFVPRLYAQGNYRVIGNVLSWYVNNHGNAYFDSENTTFSFNIETVIKTNEENLTFAEVENTVVQIPEIGDLHILIQNLFKGNKELEKSTNVLLNENWRTLFQLFCAEMEQAASMVLGERFKKIFAYVPISYFVRNMPMERTFYAMRPKAAKQPCPPTTRKPDLDSLDEQFEKLLMRFVGS